MRPAHLLAGVPIPRNAGLTRRNGTRTLGVPRVSAGGLIAAHGRRGRFETVPYKESRESRKRDLEDSTCI